MKRITRARRLTPEEIARYELIRKQVEQDLPDLIEQDRIRTLTGSTKPSGKQKESGN